LLGLIPKREDEAIAFLNVLDNQGPKRKKIFKRRNIRMGFYSGQKGAGTKAMRK